MKLKATLSVCLILSSLPALAQDAGRVSIGDFLLSRSPATAPSTQLDYSMATEVDFDAAAGGFSYQRQELDVPLTAPMHINRCNAVNLGVVYEATQLDTNTFLGNMDLHDFRINIRWIYRQPGSKWGWMALLSPGLATDGEGVNADDFSINGQVGFRYTKSPGFAWLGGVVFFSNSFDTTVYPGIGFQWKPSDDVQVTWAGPSFKASWQPHQDWLLHATFGSAGGNWNVENSGGSFDVKLRSYQAGVGVERRLSDKIWLGLWGGATFANDLEIETASGKRLFNQDADMGWFVKLGVRRIVW
ncbi:MAG: hypothetical protein H7A51_12435 [Akkermansiaceae bacterium]|nr:hypothetical protein [Akkermansiaceae bacterium]